MKATNRVLTILLTFIVYTSCANSKILGEIENETTEAGECNCKEGFCELDGKGKYVCKCPPEYGLYQGNECINCNCGKGANCTVTTSWFGGKSIECICPEGYKINDLIGCRGDCSGKPCKNGGRCKVVPPDIECLCVSPYYGENCEREPCLTNPCENNGMCELENGKTSCKCKSPFTGNLCEINQCSPNPCYNGGRCNVVKGKVNCTCKDPFTGDKCDEILDQCSPNPCLNGGKCSVVNGNVNCACKDPFTGDKCDENQCYPNPCYNGGMCNVVNGKLNCTCKDPYTGEKCDKNQCNPNPCYNGGMCNVVNGKLNCTCKHPYTGEKCDKNDHCAFSPCQNGGICRNGNYTFECTCTENYGGKDCSENVWCDKYGQYLCGREKCQYNETIGRGYCVCQNGEIFHEPSKSCIDPCTPNPCHNGGTCTIHGTVPKCACAMLYSGSTCDIDNRFITASILSILVLVLLMFSIMIYVGCCLFKINQKLKVDSRNTDTCKTPSNVL